MTHCRNGKDDRGFTLIELMIALLIFGLLASAGVMLLSGSVSAQGAVKQRLEDMALVQRASAAISADLAQAVPRISRNDEGLSVPAFWGQRAPEQPLVRFVRTGWSNLDNAPRSTLQKVEYWIKDGRLERVTYPMLDGGVSNPPATLFNDVTILHLRYRDEKGIWRDDWQPAGPDQLPRAVEMRITHASQPPLTMLFLVGPGKEARSKRDERER